MLRKNVRWVSPAIISIFILMLYYILEKMDDSNNIPLTSRFLVFFIFNEEPFRNNSVNTNMRTIKRIQASKYHSIDDLITYSPLPSGNADHIDPFLALNHFGPQEYIPNNNGLPFYPHTVQGISLISIVLEGETAFDDYNGNKNLVRPGGFHWINSGNGVSICEESSKEFIEKGGRLELVQLWINMPKNTRNRNPVYNGIQQNQIPLLSDVDHGTNIRLLVGDFESRTGAIRNKDATIVLIGLDSGGHIQLSIPRKKNILLYVIRGALIVNDRPVNKLNLVEFFKDDELVDIKSEKDSLALLAFASPVDSPLRKVHSKLANISEYQQMYRDFYRGRMNLG